MNIILIGPVSDNVERAKRVFALAEKLLTEAGHIVVHNPMRDHMAGLTEAQYMAQSLSSICNLKGEGRIRGTLCAFLLPSFRDSMGSICEYWLCLKLGIWTQTTDSKRTFPQELCEQIIQEHNRKEVTTNGKEG
jgi:hypothetical protein